ncbi:MAG: ATP-grasp domain-containing protein [Cyanobacteria bacterium]|nr:ATP-grasp domain-containing protein [Cyanobacteriota bacterium]
MTDGLKIPCDLLILGGGQLGKMLIQAARRSEISKHWHIGVWTPSGDDPAVKLADFSVLLPLELTEESVQVLEGFTPTTLKRITIEFENIDHALLKHLEDLGFWVSPTARIVEIAQHRIREKSLLASLGLPVAPWIPIPSTGLTNPTDSFHQVAGPSGAILKTATQGYDGKGQLKIPDEACLTEFIESTGIQRDYVLEQTVPFVSEFSILVARNPQGDVVTYTPIENRHQNHILHVSRWPAVAVPQKTANEAQAAAVHIADSLGLVGIMAVECFLNADGSFWVNELAPRPHNSGHLTIEAACTSQFTQHLLALSASSLGSTAMIGPSENGAALMINILGDIWWTSTGEYREPNWTSLAEYCPRATLHLYGKHTPKPGRKMGHITWLLDSPDMLESAQASLEDWICLQGR